MDKGQTGIEFDWTDPAVRAERLAAAIAGDGCSPGQTACEAWTASHKAHHPCNITAWADLREADRADWEAAAEAVLRAWRGDD